MVTEAQKSIVTRIRSAHRSNPNLLIEKLDRLNDQIRHSGGDGEQNSPIRFSALARSVNYLALDIGGAGGRRGPEWSELIREHDEISKSVGSNLFPSMTTKDGLSLFCQFKTRAGGNHSKHFYVGLLLLVICCDEDGRFNTPFMAAVLPECERAFPQQARDVFEAILDACEAPAAAAEQVGKAEPEPARPPDPEIGIRFAYNVQHLAEFADYREQFVSPEDNHAHFVVYRPSLSDPERLMKTFLAIGPAGQSDLKDSDRKDVHRFTHIYDPPEDSAGHTQRLSLGRVIALSDGVYLLGGQRDEHRARQPFKTLKIIALPWAALTRRDTVIQALIMSSNYNGRHIVSRAVLRTTPVWQAKQLRLGGVTTADLQADLERDAAVELSAIAAAVQSNPTLPDNWFAGFPLCAHVAAIDGGEGSPGEDGAAAGSSSGQWMVCPTGIREQAGFIRTLCNNAPNETTGWDIGPGFEPKRKKDPLLTQAGIIYHLEAAFGSGQAPKYTRREAGAETDEAFDFWSSIRFSPLTYD